MTAARKEANLLIAVDGRDVIGQAKGILMERYKMTEVQAFALLAASSQYAHSKLRDVADHLIATGELLGPRGDEDRQ
jgi:AmiR/NasT family two-component response regulator